MLGGGYLKRGKNGIKGRIGGENSGKTEGIRDFLFPPDGKLMGIAANILNFLGLCLWGGKIALWNNIFLFLLYGLAGRMTYARVRLLAGSKPDTRAADGLNGTQSPFQLLVRVWNKWSRSRFLGRIRGGQWFILIGSFAFSLGEVCQWAYAYS